VRIFLADVTLPTIITFVALAPHIKHDLRDKLQDYLSKLEQFSTQFFGNTKKQSRFLHIL